jgi:hypothetical protein
VAPVVASALTCGQFGIQGVERQMVSCPPVDRTLLSSGRDRDVGHASPESTLAALLTLSPRTPAFGECSVSTIRTAHCRLDDRLARPPTSRSFSLASAREEVPFLSSVSMSGGRMFWRVALRWRC